MMEILSSITGQIVGYIEGLDWSYIVTFILLSYILNHSKVTAKIRRFIKITCRTRYRVAFVGLLYGVIIWFIEGTSTEHGEILFQSFVFALVFHKLIIDLLVRRILNLNTTNDEQKRI